MVSLLTDQGVDTTDALLPALLSWPRWGGGGGRLIMLAREDDVDPSSVHSYIGLALCFDTFESCVARPALYMHDLHTRAAARRRGAGKALMAALLELCGPDKHFSELHLETTEDNLQARRLYESAGMSVGKPIFKTKGLAMYCRLLANTAPAALAANDPSPTTPAGLAVRDADLQAGLEAEAVLAQMDSFQVLLTQPSPPRPLPRLGGLTT